MDFGEDGGERGRGFQDAPPVGLGRGTGAGAGADAPPLFSKAAILSRNDPGFFGGSDILHNLLIKYGSPLGCLMRETRR